MTRPVFNIALVQRYLRKASGLCALRELYSKEWVVSPATVSSAMPAICLENDVDNVTGFAEGTSAENEAIRLSGKSREHAPTIARMIKNAAVFDGHIYKCISKIPFGTRSEHLFASVGPYREVPSASLGSSWMTSKYFGHWMLDGLSLLLAGAAIAPPIRNAAPLSQHQQQYLDHLRIQAMPMDHGRVRELVLLEDFGQNSYKRERYDVIRNHVHPEKRATHRGVMILRGQTGTQRVLTNEAQIATHLTGLGFKVLDPFQHSAPEIIQMVKGAQIVVGVEGSHMCHGLFPMATNGTLLLIQPPFRFDNVCKDFADCMGLGYALVVGQPCEGGFSLSIDKLDRILDKIDSVKAA